VQPLVSVVVPVFNGLPHLTALVDSLLAQSYPNLEIAFSEGGGSDGSLDYLRGLDDPRITVIEQPKGTTAAENWTRASHAATGEFTKLICQDDLLYPEAIEQQVGDLRRQPSAVMATASRDIVDARGAKVFRNRGLSGLKGDVVSGNAAIRECYLRGTNVIGEPLAVLFRTDALHENLPWLDSNPLMLDLSMYQKVAPLGDVALRRNSVGAFRVSSTSWSTNLAKEQVDQTREWQDTYAAVHSEAISRTDRAKAATGRTVQTSLRRLAYKVLAIRGRLTAER
jgi:glycosyltransferase involved in cell wall biosynthesis